MSIYLGQVGRLIKLPYVTSQSLAVAEQYSFKQTLEGRNAAQRLPQTFRTWALATMHFRPDEVATLVEFANGSWGRGPFVFVSADAPVTNMLPPMATSAGSGSYWEGGPMRLDDGSWAPMSTRRNDALPGTIEFGIDDAPVIPGVPVTASAWVLESAAYVLLQFYDAAGSVVGSASSDASGSVGSGVRVSVTQVSPASAVRARVTARSATQAARPAVTWTDGVREYSDGQGCAKAILHGVGRDVVKAMPYAHGGRYTNLGFTVTEVG